MIKLIMYILISYGICNILIYGSIFQKFRTIIGVDSEQPKFFGKLFSCFMCLSFWVGLFLSNIMYSPISSVDLVSDLYLLTFKIDKMFITMFLDACLSSGSVWLVHTLQERLEVT